MEEVGGLYRRFKQEVGLVETVAVLKCCRVAWLVDAELNATTWSIHWRFPMSGEDGEYLG